MSGFHSRSANMGVTATVAAFVVLLTVLLILPTVSSSSSSSVSGTSYATEVTAASFTNTSALSPTSAAQLIQLASTSENTQTVVAVDLADQIKTMPLVNDTACPSMSTVVSNILTITQDMDHSLGTNLGPFRIDPSQCDIVLQYTPILGTYDSLITASRNVNPSNSTSITIFYEDLFMLSSDFVIMNDSIAYKIAFKSTGELNDALGLATLRFICGDACYSVVLSGIHWAIRDYMNQLLCQLESYLMSISIRFTDRAC